MVEINLENLKDCVTTELSKERCLITLIDMNGAKVEIITTKENGSFIYDSIEKVCVNQDYWYSEMERENERLQLRIERLEDALESKGYRYMEAI